MKRFRTVRNADHVFIRQHIEVETLVHNLQELCFFFSVFQERLHKIPLQIMK